MSVTRANTESMTSRKVRDIMDQVTSDVLIKEVRKREILWNHKLVDYRNKRKKELAWQQVCMKIIPNYESRSPTEKKEFEKALYVRWSSFRALYKQCKKRMKVNGPPNYIFYEALTFLERVNDPNAKEPSDNCSDASSADQETDQIPNNVPAVMSINESFSYLKESRLQRDDQSFFNSLAPLLNDFNLYKKIAFRTRLLELSVDMASKLKR